MFSSGDETNRTCWRQRQFRMLMGEPIIASSSLICGFAYSLTGDLKLLVNLPVAAIKENASVENRWCQLRDAVQSTALTVLGHAGRQTYDGFDDNDANFSNLLDEKNHLLKAYINPHPTNDNKATFHRSHCPVQQRLWELQDASTACKTEEIQGADYSTLLAKKTQILQRWAEHFRSVINRSSTISDAAIARMPQVETNADLDLSSSLHKTIKAVKQLSSGKAP
ncbi:hypothetical protein SprV_0100207100 [Sparganum proliferum]